MVDRRQPVPGELTLELAFDQPEPLSGNGHESGWGTRSGRLARMQPSDYAMIARRYWATYLPSRLAGIAPDRRAAFFAALGEQVAARVEELTETNLTAALQPGQAPQVRAQRGLMAASRAQEEALQELVYLAKEPGTEDREMPRAR